MFYLLVPFRMLKRWYLRKGAKNWMPVQGHIETHDAQPHFDGRNSYFDVAVGYSYKFQGEFYSGLHTLAVVSSIEDADTESQQYPIETPVTVRVNPNRPEESMLESRTGKAGLSASQQF